MTTQINEILGYAEQDAPVSVGQYSEKRFGPSETQGANSVRVGVELNPSKDSSLPLTPQKCTDARQSFTTTQEIWAPRRRPLKMEEIRRCRCRSGELRSSATVLRPDIRGRSAQQALKVDSLLGSDVYRVHDLIQTVNGWQWAAVPKYQNGQQLGTCALAGWSGAAYRDQSLFSTAPSSYFAMAMKVT